MIIIGAGVVGLALASELAGRGEDIVVLERHRTFGQETSSRNSEIIHSGIYYPKDSLKARLCIEGRGLIYEFCSRNNIPCRRIGKLIAAADDKGAARLKTLFRQGADNGIDDLRLLDRDEIKAAEPRLRAISAIYSPSTGILDAHIFMKRLESIAVGKGVIFAYGCEAVDITRKKDGYEVLIKDADGKELTMVSKVVFNCAGLYSDRIACMAGIDVEASGYKIYYNKGEYFRLTSAKAGLLNHLIYPTPTDTSLGIHTVTDMRGELKLGPNSFYVDGIGYGVERAHVNEFYDSVKGLLPFIEEGDLMPDTSGIRPKLQAPGNAQRDFLISDEEAKGLPGFINLIGIESPGLTASLSIAKYAAAMV